MSYNRSLLNFITKNLDKKPSKPSVPKNQWQHPGEVTKVNSPNITMDAVSYPVIGVPNVGQPQMMYPDQQYNFPQASSVTEFPMMAKGGYVVTRSNDRKGKTHKVTGPDGTVKYFGDSSMGQHPKDPERKKAFYARHKKNLAANPYFRAFARKTWEQGGELMQFGGLWDSNRTAWVDSVNNANMDKNFVQRMYNPNGPQMFLPGDKRPSTHFMESGDGRAYPTVVQRPGNKYLEWLNQNNRNGAYNYAANTGQYIQFPNDVQANWYAANGYKQGTNVVTGKKKMQPGGSVNNIWNAAKAVGNYMINQPDTNAENIVEVFDPFGASSWDDVIRSYNQTGMSGETGLELLGAVPFFGKLGKLSKPGIHLKKYQKLDKALYKNLPKNSILSNGFTGLGAAGKVTDAYQAYNQYAEGGSLTKYQTQGEVYRDPEHKNPNISETGQKVINGISYLFDDVPAAINSLVGKAISPFVYNNITQKDKEELFKKYRPIDYPSVFKAIGTTVNNAFSSKGPKPVRYDDKGNLSIEEEAWRKALDLPTKANYIQESKYRPTSAKDPNAKYYTLHPNVIDPQKLIDYVKSGEWDKNKQLSKNGKDYYTQMSTFAPFIKESWKERQGIDEEDFKNIDPLQRFQMFKGYDPVKKKNYVSISDRYDFDFAPAQKVIKPYDIYDRFYYQDGGQKYTVKEGEYLSQIAKANNISVEDLVLANKISNPNLIKPNQELTIPERTRGYSNPGAGGFQGFEQLQKMQEQLSQLPNDQMVKEYRKQFNVPGNYAMVDKKSGKMSIYDQSGKELNSFPVGTGKVIGDEYTINTTGPNRRNSTPAGIFTLTNKGSGRDSYAPHYGDNIWEMIDHNGVQQATALHQVPNELPYRNALIGDANPANNRLSNGCINCRRKDFDTGVEKFLGKDSQVYILPEDQNNYFRVKNNKLVLTGDNFNPNVLYSKKDLNARPLQIKYAKSQFPNSLDNVQQMAQSLVDNKQKLMKDLKIDNDTYNELTRLTLGMAGQESNYGDHPAYWYKEKWPLAQLDITMAKQLKNLANFKNPLDISPNSRGFTQIKYESQNKEVRDLFAKYGIKGPDDLANPAKSNIASLIMLGYMNNNELPQLKDKMKKLNLSKSDALLYLNQGKKSQITNMTATPQKNKYIRSVNDYAKRFVLNQKEQGGPVMGQEIEVSPDEMAELRKQGYKFKVVK